MFILGDGLYGRCDFVPGRFHVATRFFTFFFVPLIPIEGTIVLEDHGTSYRGVKIPISAKSLALSWARAALWAPGVVLLLTGLYSVYCYLAGEHLADGELMKFLGGGALLVAAGVGSMFLGFKASFLRAIQLGIAAGVSPQQIATEYGKPLPDEATLDRLAQAIRPTVAETGSTLGPVGRVICFLILAWIGFALFSMSGLQLLKKGYGGWEASLWAVPAGLGLVLVMQGVIMLNPRRLRGFRRFAIAAIVFITIVAFVGGPWLSQRWWRPEEEHAWQEYLGVVEKSLDADTQYQYGTSSTAPYALHRPAFFLVNLLMSGTGHFSLRDPATDAWHGSDPHYQAVKVLADSIEADKDKTGPARWETRREQLRNYLPTLKGGGWPDEVR